MAAFTAIDDAGSYYNTTLYDGTGASNAITGVGFAPDMVWVKNLASTTNQVIFDTVRGTTKSWYANETDVEVTDANGLTAFGADGFTVGSWVQSNTSGNDYASWNWNMGTTTGISGSPSTTPTGYSFSAAAGQSIITYVGTSVAGGGPSATLPHGLGKAPEFIMVKNLTQGARDNNVYHEYIGNTHRLYLNQDAASIASSSAWDDTSPTSTLFTVGGNEATNELDKNFAAYCFTSIQGYSKFGDYIGNGDADGQFINLGFRPAFLLIKRTDGVANWYMFDNKRLGYNVDNNANRPDENWSRDTTDVLDLLSNGFKLKASSSSWNGSGDEYIYAAFADNPFVNSNGVPGTSRFQA